MSKAISDNQIKLFLRRPGTANGQPSKIPSIFVVDKYLKPANRLASG